MRERSLLSGDDLDEPLRLRLENAHLRRRVEGLERGLADMRLRALAVDHAAVGVVIADMRAPDCPIIWVNEAFERTTGYDAFEVVGRNCRFLQGRDHDQPGLVDLRAALREGRPTTVNLRNYRRDGTEFMVRLSVSPVMDPDGSVTHYIGFQQDVTRERALEEEVARTHDHMVQAQQIAGLGTWSWNTATGRIHWSPQVFHIHGVDPGAGEPSIDGLPSLYHNDDWPRLQVYIQACLANGTPYQGDLRIRRPDGEIRIIETRGERRISGAGVLSLIGVVRDVTESRTASERLQRTIAELEVARDAAQAAAKAKSTFLATMSHEIRTPMNGILGTAELLRAEPLPPSALDLVDVIQASGETLLVVINDILDLSKVEAGKMELEDRAFDLRSCLHNAAGTLRATAQAKGLSLVVDLAPELPAWIRGDEVRIRQILTNLLSNAVKFTNAGYVRLSARSEAREGRHALRLSVSDTGIGMNEAQLQNLFEAFTQAHSSTTRKYGGTGLGLAICQRLAALMGGTVTVRSKPNEGTTFTAHLVVGPAEAVAPTRNSEPGQLPTDLDVLLVEDNPVNLMVATKMLQRLGVLPRTAINGLRALDEVARRIPDVILMDMEMPVMDGLTATRRIREIFGAAVRIVGLTANAMAESRAACLEAGMDDHVSKPINAATLAAALAEVRPRAWKMGA